MEAEGITLVVPAWNEEAGIAETLSQAKEALAACGTETEMIVVDDGSADRTNEIAAASGAKVIRHAVNLGYGKSLQEGMEAAQHPLVAIVDADGTYPLKELPRLVAEMRDCAMVVGARQGPAYRGSPFKNPARYVFRWLAEFAAGRTIPDINSGFRVFRRADVEPFRSTLPIGFSFPTTLTLAFMLNGKGVKYVPIDYYGRKGKSKVRIVRDSLRSAQSIVTAIALYNPLKLFLLLATVCWVFALVCAVPGIGWGIGAAQLLAGEGFLAGLLVTAMGLLAVRVRRSP